MKFFKACESYQSLSGLSMYFPCENRDLLLISHLLINILVAQSHAMVFLAILITFIFYTYAKHIQQTHPWS